MYSQCEGLACARERVLQPFDTFKILGIGSEIRFLVPSEKWDIYFETFFTSYLFLVSTLFYIYDSRGAWTGGIFNLAGVEHLFFIFSRIHD
jgi:hypothetical protein